jgi:hypothetical protein
MSGVTRHALLQRALARVGVIATGGDDDERTLAGLLADFRSDLDGLRGFLDGVPDADEVVERFALLAAAAGAGSDREHGSFDAYLVVRRPAACARHEAEGLLRDHFASMSALAREVGLANLAECLARDVAINWIAAGEPLGHGDLDLRAYEELGDELDMARLEHPISVLREAAYTIAASNEIARFVLWPAFRCRLATPDPYRDYVELWRRGIEWRHHGDRIVAFKRTAGS